jgi:uncharacterized protein
MSLSVLDAAILFVAALAAGAMNAVAGGGSFVTFPALLFVGVSPIVANATSTVALWPGSLASSLGYRRELKALSRYMLGAALASLAGGGLGALLMIRTPTALFMRLLPFMMLIAAVVFSVGDKLKAKSGESRPLKPLVLALLQFPIALYGGYFGGGMGFMMLAAFTVAGFVDLHQMNGLKSFLALLINAVAIATFLFAGAVDGWAAAVMIVGATAGGFGGSSLARRWPSEKVRPYVAVLGWGLTAYFFLRTWLA